MTKTNTVPKRFASLYLLQIFLQLLNDKAQSNEYFCPETNFNNNNVKGKTRNNFHIRGTSIGGWLVIEPWITPSLFYQFLGASERWGDDAPKHIGLDTKTFCEALGDEEANRQLRRHWQTWVTEKEIRDIKHSGADTVRIPVGDWMYQPYEPYIGCMDGALDELERVLRLCDKYNLRAILDLHAVKGSQNGLDNSGDSNSIEWVSTVSSGEVMWCMCVDVCIEIVF